MNHKKSLLLILGDQLFAKSHLDRIEFQEVFMAEDIELCKEVQHHKQKVMLFLSSMRGYRDDLIANKINVDYRILNPEFKKNGLIDQLRMKIESESIKILHLFAVDDHFFASKLAELSDIVELKEHESPKFICSKVYFKAYLEKSKKPFMKTFYEMVRRETGILMTPSGQPIGDKYSFDGENRKKLPKKIEIPKRRKFEKSIYFDDVARLVENHFPDHIGETSDFNWPSTRHEYLQVFQDFMTSYTAGFGPYQDAISTRDRFLFHSLLSPGLNLGLITPGDVTGRLQGHLKEFPEHIASIEGIVRQIIGWREFVKGIYDNFSSEIHGQNYWKHERKMKPCWYEGTTGLPPVDDAIKKARSTGYGHHIERLMILANIFNLTEIQPEKVYSWFMEMYIDSAHWVMEANVYCMGLMSEGGIFATKPYISGSNYIMKMSDYPKGDWCEIWDGLYWRFIDKHRDFFSKHPRMRMLVSTLNKIPEDRYARIINKANKFIDETSFQ